MSIIRLGKNRWRVQIRRKGLPTFDKVAASKARAEALHAEYLAELDKTSRPSELTLRAAWEAYQNSLDFERKSENSQKTERCRIQPVLEELGQYALLRLRDAPRLIYDYMDRRSKIVSKKTRKKISLTSIRLEIAALSAVVAWAKRRQIIDANFVRHIDRPGQAKRARRVPLLEQGKLNAAVMHFDEPLRAECARFLTLLRCLGCRPGELAALRRIDINFEGHEATFRNTKHKGESRLVHLTDEALGLTDAQLLFGKEKATESPYLFSTKRRGKAGTAPAWAPYNYSWQVQKLKEAGIVAPDFHPHAMRREYISRAIEHGLPYATIRKQTGHHSTQAIEIYDEGLSTAPEIRQALDKFAQATHNEWLLDYLESLGLSKQSIAELKSKMNGKTPEPIRPVFRSQE